MANTPDSSQNKTPMTDEERQELRAMIAAGRDLSPEMDDSLVDSYAERRAEQKRAQAKVQGNEVVAQQPNTPFGAVNPAVAICGMAMVAAIFIVVMVVSHGWLWWMIFPLMGIFGGWWGRDERHRIRDERRAQRYQMRADYYRQRMGYPAREDERRLPESSQASESSERDSAPLPPPTSAPRQTPPAPRSIPPASSAPSGGEQPPINPAG